MGGVVSGWDCGGFFLEGFLEGWRRGGGVEEEWRVGWDWGGVGCFILGNRDFEHARGL